MLLQLPQLPVVGLQRLHTRPSGGPVSGWEAEGGFEHRLEIRWIRNLQPPAGISGPGLATGLLQKLADLPPVGVDAQLDGHQCGERLNGIAVRTGEFGQFGLDVEKNRWLVAVAIEILDRVHLRKTITIEIQRPHPVLEVHHEVAGGHRSLGEAHQPVEGLPLPVGTRIDAAPIQAHQLPELLMEPLQTGLAIVEPVLPAHQKVHVHGGGPHTRRALRMGPEGHGIAGFRGTQCKPQRQFEPVFLVADGEGDTAQTLQGRDPPVHEHRAQLTHPGAADQQIVVAAVVADAIAAVLAGVQAGAGRQQHLLHPPGQAEQHGHPVRAGRQRRHPQLIPIEVIEMATHDAVLLIPQMAKQRHAGEQQGEMGTRQPTGRLVGEALGIVDVGRHVGRRQGEPAGGRWCGQGIPVRQPGGRG